MSRKIYNDVKLDALVVRALADPVSLDDISWYSIKREAPGITKLTVEILINDMEALENEQPSITTEE